MPKNSAASARPPALARLERAYRQGGAAGSGLLLAVSGGWDSTFLMLASAHLAPELRLRLEVASLDHGLRPESAAEVETVRLQAEALGLAFHTAELAVGPGSGVEARARELRYAALERIRLRAGLDWVVTAHTASDQAETLLMRLARGTSLRGAGAIRARAGRVLRPLLEVTRAEGKEALAALGGGVPFDDPMNRDPSFFRVRVRTGALPALEAAAGFGVARQLARFAQLAGEDEAFLSGLASEAYARVRVGVGELDAVAVRALAAPLKRRVLARFLEEAGALIDQPLVASAVEAVDTGGTATLPRDLILKAHRALLRIEPAPARRVG
jgi:tRNA(Ile)-lysidine synthase